MGFLGDLLFGTQDDAAAQNQANVNKALDYYQGVPIAGLYGQARDALGRNSGQPHYQQALALLGQAGTGASLETLQREREAVGANRQQQAQRGLFGSSLAAGANTGIRAATDRTLAGIQGQTAAAQGQVKMAQGQEAFRRDLGLSGLYANQAGAELQRAGGQANVLQNTQVEGSPGLLGTIVSGGLGFLGSYYAGAGA